MNCHFGPGEGADPGGSICVEPCSFQCQFNCECDGESSFGRGEAESAFDIGDWELVADKLCSKGARPVRIGAGAQFWGW